MTSSRGKLFPLASVAMIAACVSPSTYLWPCQAFIASSQNLRKCGVIASFTSCLPKSHISLASRGVGSTTLPNSASLFMVDHPESSEVPSDVPSDWKYIPVFDFSAVDDDSKRDAVDSFERIDDAIMGGISLSSLKDVPGEPYASWSGVCRTDGG